jgi:hypothetical protein
MSIHPLYGDPDLFEVRVPVATMWTSPEAARAEAGDADAVHDHPDVAGWAAAVRTQDLVGRTSSQLLLGEPVHVLEERDGWVRGVALLQKSAQHEQGYPGWLRRAHLGSPVMRTEGPIAYVVTRSASCHTDAERSFGLSFGTALWVDGLTETTVTVLLPGGRSGSVDLADVALSHKRQQPLYGADDLLDLARQFLGLKYVWGGTSTWGLDCSGLVHLTHRALGVTLPRDAADMATSPDLAPVPLDEVQPGDLYFFATPEGRVTHVGFVTRPVQPDGVRWMLHAPEGGGFIEECPMAPERAASLVSAGRVRKPDAGQFPRSAGE